MYRKWLTCNNVDIDPLVGDVVDRSNAESIIFTRSISNDLGNQLSYIDLLIFGDGA